MEYRGTVNTVELIGWLGQDPEMRFTPQGTAVTTISVATKRPSHANGEIKTDWITVEAWEKLAEQINTHLRKGSRVRVVGYLVTSSGIVNFIAEQVLWYHRRHDNHTILTLLQGLSLSGRDHLSRGLALLSLLP